MKKFSFIVITIIALQACDNDSVDNYVTLEKKSIPTAAGANITGGLEISSAFESFQPMSNLKIDADTTLYLLLAQNAK